MKPPYKNLSDTNEELAKVPLLADWLRQWREETDPAYGRADVDLYKKFDQAATSLRWWHRWIVTFAAVCGGLAIIVAIAHLALEAGHLLEKWKWIDWAWWIEGLFALIALVAVGFGLWAQIAKTWVLERFRAERIRHLKYQALSQRIHAKQDLPTSLKYIRDELTKIKTADFEEAVKQMKERLQEVEPVNSPPKSLTSPMSEQMAEYVNRTYLKEQEEYFVMQSKKRRNWEAATRHAGPITFFFSVACALAHFVVDAFEHWKHPGQNPHDSPLVYFSIALLFLAAAAPVVGAVVRTIRSAHEFGRNANRFDAVRFQLIAIQKNLADNYKQEELEVPLMWFIRGVWLLETEQLAWMRLMHEAEWFG